MQISVETVARLSSRVRNCLIDSSATQQAKKSNLASWYYTGLLWYYIREK